MFSLHKTLEDDSVRLGNFPLSLVLMSRDLNYPWFILVPRREGIREHYQLARQDQYQLLEESNTLSLVLMEAFSGDKLNVAALGNMVPQLHVHHIVRYRNDPAWPGPVWGAVPPLGGDESLQRQRAQKVIDQLRNGFEAF